MKKKIIFLGAFNSRNNKNVIGGQVFASNSLVNSNLSKKYIFLKIDSTQRRIPPPNLIIRFLDAFLRILKLLNLILTNKIHCIILFTSDGLGFLEKGLMVIISKKFNINTILFPRSGLIINDVKSKKFVFFLKKILKNTDVLMVQGNSWRSFYNQYVNEKTQIIVQQNWINVKKYLYPKRNFKNKEIKILFLGWIDINKGILDLLDAFNNLIKSKKYDLKLFIAGEGKDFSLVKQKINKYKLSSFVKTFGWVNELEKINLLKKSDIYVHPSYFEGFPNSLLEAMISGIPSITTNVGSITDIAIDNQNSLIFQPSDIKTLEHQLIKLIDSSCLRQKISEQAVASIVKNNSINSAVKNLDDIFQTIN